MLSGDVPACRWVRLACKRYLNDLERSDKDDTWPYRYDLARAEHVCRSIEQFPHIKGVLAGQKLQLSPWQCFILCQTFGWVHRKTGARRFRKVYVEVPRKNGKSTLSSGVGLYLLAMDGENGAEVYSAATSRDQARIVFDVAKQMAENRTSTAFRKKFGVRPLANSITAPSGSFFKPISAVGKTNEGLNPHGAIIDELHAHTTRQVYDVLNTATGARAQPFLWVITTAGDNRAGVCFEQHRYIEKILDGAVEDDTYFGIIFTIDEDDDWTTEEAWAKANPNYGVSVNKEKLKSDCLQAQVTASLQHSFKTRHLNVWVNAASGWMNMQSWEACRDDSLKLEDFEGRTCFIALDLASKRDVVSKVYIFPTEAEPKMIYPIFWKHWLPKDRIEQSGNASYAGWVEDGRLEAMPGPVIDFDAIEDSLREDAKRFDVQEFIFDPWQAFQMMNRLDAEGLTVVELRPTVGNFSEPMKEFEALVLSERLPHDGCPVAEWMVSNTVVKRDAKDNIYPLKEGEENKIDGVVAGIMGLNRVLADGDFSPSESVYEERGFVEL
ncbi:MAG: terminase large subunit [Alphaproteobacteria bacterium]